LRLDWLIFENDFVNDKKFEKNDKIFLIDTSYFEKLEIIKNMKCEFKKISVI